MINTVENAKRGIELIYRFKQRHTEETGQLYADVSSLPPPRPPTALDSDHTSAAEDYGPRTIGWEPLVEAKQSCIFF